MRRRAGSVAVLIARGESGRGGIERGARYLRRRVAADAPDLAVFIQRTRFSEMPVIKHATVAPALMQFIGRCLSRRVAVAHVKVAAHGSTLRKMLFVRAARMVGARILLHIHGDGYDNYFESAPAWFRRRIARFFQRADRVVVLGGHWERFARDALKVPAERLLAIDNGVPGPPCAAPRGRRDMPVILFAGCLGERKGTDVLLKSLAALRRRGLRFRMVLCGDGEVGRYKAMAERLGLRDITRFTGWLEEGEIGVVMADADIFVLPSRSENQPVAILEAMAHALPVVSTLIAAIPEQVAHGRSGLLVPAGDVDALAEALGRLVEDAELRGVMGSVGRALWEERYSIAATARKILAVYRELADAEL